MMSLLWLFWIGVECNYYCDDTPSSNHCGTDNDESHVYALYENTVLSSGDVFRATTDHSKMKAPGNGVTINLEPSTAILTVKLTIEGVVSVEEGTNENEVIINDNTVTINKNGGRIYYRCKENYYGDGKTCVKLVDQPRYQETFQFEYIHDKDSWEKSRNGGIYDNSKYYKMCPTCDLWKESAEWFCDAYDDSQLNPAENCLYSWKAVVNGWYSDFLGVEYIVPYTFRDITDVNSKIIFKYDEKDDIIFKDDEGKEIILGSANGRWNFAMVDMRDYYGEDFDIKKLKIFTEHQFAYCAAASLDLCRAKCDDVIDDTKQVYTYKLISNWEGVNFEAIPNVCVADNNFPALDLTDRTESININIGADNTINFKVYGVTTVDETNNENILINGKVNIKILEDSNSGAKGTFTIKGTSALAVTAGLNQKNFELLVQDSLTITLTNPIDGGTAPKITIATGSDTTKTVTLSKYPLEKIDKATHTMSALTITATDATHIKCIHSGDNTQCASKCKLIDGELDPTYGKIDETTDSEFTSHTAANDVLYYCVASSMTLSKTPTQGAYLNLNGLITEDGKFGTNTYKIKIGSGSSLYLKTVTTIDGHDTKNIGINSKLTIENLGTLSIGAGESLSITGGTTSLNFILVLPTSPTTCSVTYTNNNIDAGTAIHPIITINVNGVSASTIQPTNTEEAKAAFKLLQFILKDVDDIDYSDATKIAVKRNSGNQLTVFTTNSITIEAHSTLDIKGGAVANFNLVPPTTCTINYDRDGKTIHPTITIDVEKINGDAVKEGNDYVKYSQISAGTGFTDLQFILKNFDEHTNQASSQIVVRKHRKAELTLAQTNSITLETGKRLLIHGGNAKVDFIMKPTTDCYIQYKNHESVEGNRVSPVITIDANDIGPYHILPTHNDDSASNEMMARYFHDLSFNIKNVDIFDESSKDTFIFKKGEGNDLTIYKTKSISIEPYVIEIAPANQLQKLSFTTGPTYSQKLSVTSGHLNPIEAINVIIKHEFDLTLVDPINKYYAPSVSLIKLSGNPNAFLNNYPSTKVSKAEGSESITITTNCYLICNDKTATACTSITTFVENSNNYKVIGYIQQNEISESHKATLYVLVTSYSSSNPIQIDTSALNYQDINFKGSPSGFKVIINNFVSIDQTNKIRLISSNNHGADIFYYSATVISLIPGESLSFTAGSTPTDITIPITSALKLTLMNPLLVKNVPQITIENSESTKPTLSLVNYPKGRITYTDGTIEGGQIYYIGDCGTLFNGLSESPTPQQITDTTNENYKSGDILYICQNIDLLREDPGEKADVALNIYINGDVTANNILSRAHNIYIAEGKKLVLTYVSEISEENGVISTKGSAPLTIHNSGTLDVTLDEKTELVFTETSFTSSIILRGYKDNAVKISGVTTVKVNNGGGTQTLKVGKYVTIESISKNSVIYSPVITLTPTTSGDQTMSITGSDSVATVLGFILELAGDASIIKNDGQTMPDITFYYSSITASRNLIIDEFITITMVNVPNINKIDTNKYQIKGTNNNNILTIYKNGDLIIKPLEEFTVTSTTSDVTYATSSFYLDIEKAILIILSPNQNRNTVPTIKVKSNEQYITYYNYPKTSIKYYDGTKDNDYPTDKLKDGTKKYCFGTKDNCFNQNRFLFYPNNVKDTFSSLPTLSADVELYIASSTTFGDVTADVKIIICDSNANTDSSKFSNQHGVTIQTGAKLTISNIDEIEATTSKLIVNSKNKGKLTITKEGTGELMIVPSTLNDITLTATNANGPTFGLTINSPLLLTSTSTNKASPPKVLVTGNNYITYIGFTPTNKIRNSDDQSDYSKVINGETSYCYGSNKAACLTSCSIIFKPENIIQSIPATGITSGDIYIITSVNSFTNLKASVNLYFYVKHSIPMDQITTNNHIVQMRILETITISGVSSVSASNSNQLEINNRLKIQKYFPEESPSLIIEAGENIAITTGSNNFPFNIILNSAATQITGSNANGPTMILDVSKVSTAKSLTIGTATITVTMKEVAKIEREETANKGKFIGKGQTAELTVVNNGKIDVTLCEKGTVNLKEADFTNDIIIHPSTDNTIAIEDVTKVETKSDVIGELYVSKITIKGSNIEDYSGTQIKLTLKTIDTDTTLPPAPSTGIKVDNLNYMPIIEIVTGQHYTIKLTDVDFIDKVENKGLIFNRKLIISKNGNSLPKLVDVTLITETNIYYACSIEESAFIYPVTITGSVNSKLNIKEVSTIAKVDAVPNNGLKYGTNLIIKNTNTVYAYLQKDKTVTLSYSELTYVLGIMGDSSNSIKFSGVTDVNEKVDYTYNFIRYYGIKLNDKLFVYKHKQNIASLTVVPSSGNKITVTCGNYLLGFNLEVSQNSEIELNIVTGSNIEHLAPYAPPIKVSTTAETKTTITLTKYPTNKISYDSSKIELSANSITLYCLDDNKCGDVCFINSKLNSGFKGYSSSQESYKEGDILYVNKAGTDLKGIPINVELYFCVSDTQTTRFESAHTVKVQNGKTLTLTNVEKVNNADNTKLIFDSLLTLEADLVETQTYYPSLIVEPKVGSIEEGKSGLDVDFASSTTSFSFELILTEADTTITKKSGTSQPIISLDVSKVNLERKITIEENIQLFMKEVAKIENDGTNNKFTGNEQTAKLTVVNKGILDIELSKSGIVSLKEDELKNTKIHAKELDSITLNDVTIINVNSQPVVGKVGIKDYTITINNDLTIQSYSNSKPNVEINLKTIEAATTTSIDVDKISANVIIKSGKFYTIQLTNVNSISAAATDDGLKFNDVLTISRISSGENGAPDLVEVTLVSTEITSIYDVCNLDVSKFDNYFVTIIGNQYSRLNLKEVVSILKVDNTPANGLKYGSTTNSESPKLTIKRTANDNKPIVVADIQSSVATLSLTLTIFDYQVILTGTSSTQITFDKVRQISEKIDNDATLNEIVTVRKLDTNPGITVIPETSTTDLQVTAGANTGIEFTIHDIKATNRLTLVNPEHGATAPYVRFSFTPPTPTPAPSSKKLLGDDPKIKILVTKYPYKKLKLEDTKVETDDKVIMHCLYSNAEDCQTNAKLVSGEYEPVESIEEWRDTRYNGRDIFYITKSETNLINILDDGITIVLCDNVKRTTASIGKFSNYPQIYIRNNAELKLSEVNKVVLDNANNNGKLKVGNPDLVTNQEAIIYKYNKGTLTIIPSIHGDTFTVSGSGSGNDVPFNLLVQGDLTISGTGPSIYYDYSEIDHDYTITLQSSAKLTVKNVEMIKDKSSGKFDIYKANTPTLTIVKSSGTLVIIPSNTNILDIIPQSSSSEFTLKLENPLLVNLNGSKDNAPIIYVDNTDESNWYITYNGYDGKESQIRSYSYIKDGNKIYCVGSEEVCFAQTRKKFLANHVNLDLSATHPSNWGNGYELYIAEEKYEIKDTIETQVKIYICNTGIKSSLDTLKYVNPIDINDKATFTLSKVKSLTDSNNIIETGQLTISDKSDDKNQFIVEPLVTDNAGLLSVNSNSNSIPFKVSIANPLYLQLDSESVNAPSITVNSPTSEYITLHRYSKEKIILNKETKYSNVKDVENLICLGEDNDCTTKSRIKIQKLFASLTELNTFIDNYYYYIDVNDYDINNYYYFDNNFELYIAKGGYSFEAVVPDELPLYICNTGISGSMDILNNKHDVVIYNEAELTLSNMKDLTEKDGKIIANKLTISITGKGKLIRKCYSGYGSETCNICKAGTKGGGSSDPCQPCPIGRYSNEGSSECNLQDIYYYCGDNSKCSNDYSAGYRKLPITEGNEAFEENSKVVIYPRSYGNGLTLDVVKFNNQEVIIPTTSSMELLDSNSLTIGSTKVLTGQKDKSTRLQGEKETETASFPESDNSYLVVAFDDLLIIKQEEGAEFTKPVALAPQKETASIELDKSVDLSKQSFTISKESKAETLYVFTGDKEVSKDELKKFIDTSGSKVKVEKQKGTPRSVKKGLSGGAIAGIVIGCLAFVAIVVVVVILVLRKNKNDESPPV